MQHERVMPPLSYPVELVLPPLSYLDPRTKLLGLVITNMVLFMTTDIYSEWMNLFVISVMLCLMGVPKLMFRYLTFYIILMGIIVLSLFIPIKIGVIVQMCALSFRKMLVVFMLANGVIASTRVSELMSALQALYVPKFIVIPFAITLRFFPSAKQDLSQIRAALKLRGITFSLKNLFCRPLFLMESLLIPLMLRSALTAEALSVAAITRGIDSPKQRSSIYRLRFCWRDAMALVLFLFVIMITALGGVKEVINDYI